MNKLGLISLNKTLSLHVVVCLLLGPWLLTAYFCVSKEVLLEPLKITLVALYTWCVLSSLMARIHILHPYFLFLGSFFLFLTYRVFYATFTGDNNSIFEIDVFSRYIRFPIKIVNRTLVIISFFMLFMHLGALLAFVKMPKLKIANWQYNKKWAQMGQFLFWIFIIPATIYYLNIASLLIEGGYSAKIGLDYGGESLIFRLSDDLAILGFYVFLCAKPPLKKLIIPTVIFSALSILMGFTGARVLLLIQVVVLFFYYGIRIRIAKVALAIIFPALILISTAIIMYKGSYNSSVIKAPMKEQIHNFFYSNSLSYNVTSLGLYYLDNGDIKKAVYPIFSPIVASFIDSYMGSGMSESLNLKKYTADQIADLYIGEERKEMVAGVGSSNVLEIYLALGLLGLCVFTLLYFYVIIIGFERFRDRPCGLLIILYIVPGFIYSVRAHPLGLFSELWKGLALILICFAFLKICHGCYAKIKNIEILEE